ncbi:conserved membrane hypothetical protein [uncultured delta proteobacterium]|uniref:Sulfatase N-terminal domain-containing protein n=1 Tax=uncultured delta proteobacterium TaxID=34034 RepID=A0A212JEJ7_9DELT|nr:conserved membrane hypothetical protein [uncultured delta proteobacterium]
MKKFFLESLGPFRVHYLTALGVLFLGINIVVRLVLQAAFPAVLPFSAVTFAGLVMGLLNDAATLAFVLLLPATCILIPTNAFLQRPAGRIYAQTILFLYSFICVFTAFAEYFFWDEFNSRFNFIAVDYLIYTTEVMGNIVESYPILPLITGSFLLSLGITAAAWKWIQRSNRPGAEYPRDLVCGSGYGGRRILAMIGIYASAALVFMLFTPFGGNKDRYWNEYAKNGVYELFSAYRNNQLDYRAFYKTMNKRDAFALLQSGITDAKPSFAPPRGDSLVRIAEARTAAIRPNVIVVMMESMGSKWLGEYTPNLNALAANGLSFSNMMATGTRTVRGIEAVMLSIPPTPGNSIVRRPDNDRLFNLGTEFHRNGYDLTFIYGGIGFFDNMNSFFAGNGYTVVDKLGFSRENKTFATAWGQCDEDLYAESLTRADASHAAGKPFQQFLLTTSNHRPYTYPDGKVSIAPGTSRKGAVSYSDYAIGAFMREAGTKPWFDNTIFIFVGDHPASIAGKTALPGDAYGIVCIMYGPRFFQPEQVTALCSQIDVAPTLLAALGWEYHSQFFGTNAREIPENEGRAWISTYQLLGLRTDDHLVVLSPDGQAKVEALNGNAATEKQKAQLVARAVASYQCAYDLYAEKKLSENIVTAYMPTFRRPAGTEQKAGTPKQHEGGRRNGIDAADAKAEKAAAFTLLSAIAHGKGQ